MEGMETDEASNRRRKSEARPFHPPSVLRLFVPYGSSRLRPDGSEEGGNRRKEARPTHEQTGRRRLSATEGIVHEGFNHPW